MWNNAFRYILEIKKLYGQWFDDNEVSVLKMCLKLIDKNTELHFDDEKCLELDNFLHCVDIRVKNGLNLFRYSMTKGGNINIESNPDSIYREMRSLVIDIEKECIVLCPFRKFFNINEIAETSLDNVMKKIKDAGAFEVSDKLDGSMQCGRYYDNRFVMVGSRTFVGDDYRITDGYKMLLNNADYQRCMKDYSSYTFIFEFISFRDKHIVDYDREGLYLIGMRDIETGCCKTYKEIVRIAEEYGILTTVLENNSIENVLFSVKTYKASEKEGWVLRVGDNMYKLKCEDYLRVHILYGDMSNHNYVIKAVAENYIDDVLSALPESRKQFVLRDVRIVKLYVATMQALIDKHYNRVKHIEDQKEFALEVQKIVPSDFQKYMYSLRKGREINVLKTGSNGYVKSVCIFGE